MIYNSIVLCVTQKYVHCSAVMECLAVSLVFDYSGHQSPEMRDKMLQIGHVCSLERKGVPERRVLLAETFFPVRLKVIKTSRIRFIVWMAIIDLAGDVINVKYGRNSEFSLRTNDNF